MGVVRLAEIIRNLDAGSRAGRDLVQRRSPADADQKGFEDSFPAIVRGTILGSISHPARRRCGHCLVRGIHVRKEDSQMYSVAVRPRCDRRGVAAPKSAQTRRRANLVNPAAHPSAYRESGDALMVGAMTIHGIVPGQQVIRSRPNWSGDDSLDVGSGNRM